MNHSMQFVFQNDLQQAFHHFTSLLGIRIGFFSPDGTEVMGLPKPICAYCQLLRKDLDLESCCLDLDRKRQEQASRERRLISYQCHGGMHEAVLPVYYDENLIGFIMIGQFRTKDVLPSKLRQQWSRQHQNDVLYDAFQQAPFFTSAQVIEVLGLFTILVDYVVTKRLVRVQQSNPIDSLITYLNEHPQANLSLAQAARLIFRSPSTLSQLFKKQTGMSFKQYQIKNKLDHADRLLKTQDSIAVQDVAHKLGFNDPLYFSRLYTKHRGFPPSQLHEQES